MKLADVLDQLPTDRGAKRGYGEPYETADGATVIPVASIGVGRARRRFHRGEQNAQADQDAPAFGFAAVPMGVITGLLAAVIGTLAVLRQPPWPRITITDYR
ncbi:hypothetical protein MHAE_13073 [Mycobacterium haemophilum DSM 44634]|uniref:hypothetical protein n=1 Tax=Mycobacterium haemophilum TaxID=29311 RepID=UPI0006559D76|nr:hypothetical protein [Mycobacterium haemophilum]AKN15424.1 hypothetical protein B586_00815 [Mycobacterium haemophilum DSM 44634]MCV7342292.1 hypothetical protein [Mycobacterium haemophilum DSM 44634]